MFRTNVSAHFVSAKGTGKTIGLIIKCVAEVDFESSELQCILLTRSYEDALSAFVLANDLSEPTAHLQIQVLFKSEKYTKGSQLIIGTPNAVVPALNVDDLSKVKWIFFDDAETTSSYAVCKNWLPNVCKMYASTKSLKIGVGLVLQVEKECATEYDIYALLTKNRYEQWNAMKKIAGSVLLSNRRTVIFLKDIKTAYKLKEIIGEPNSNRRSYMYTIIVHDKDLEKKKRLQIQQEIQKSSFNIVLAVSSVAQTLKIPKVDTVITESYPWGTCFEQQKSIAEKATIVCLVNQINIGYLENRYPNVKTVRFSV